MSTITEVKCVLSQKAFDVFCEKFHIPKEIHLVLPNPGDTMHERPSGKIGLYTRFIDFANFRLSLSTFLVNILRHFCINISQLSVIGAAKVSHFEILCHVYEITPTVGLFRCFYVNSKKNGWMSFIKRSDKSHVCYTKPLDSLKNLNDHFFWVDDFACPARFPWHTTKNMTRDPAPIAADFNAQDYATLVAHPSPFWKEDMDIFAFIHTPDPNKVKVVELERKDDEPRLLETNVGPTVPLLLVAPNRGESELNACVDKLFDEPRRQKKRKTTIADGSGPSHPPKKLREDHETSSQSSVGGKSKSAVQRLFAGAVQNVEVRGEPIPTLPFVTSSVFATPEPEGKDYTNSMTGPNLRTISALQRFVISSNSSHHSGSNVAKAEADSLVMSSVPVMTVVTTTTPMADPAVIVKEKLLNPPCLLVILLPLVGLILMLVFFFILPEVIFLLVVSIVITPDTDLQKVYVPQWSVTNGSRLDDSRVVMKWWMNLLLLNFLRQFVELNTTNFSLSLMWGLRGRSLSAEVRIRAEDEEIENLKAQMLLKEAEAIYLRAKASNFTDVEKSLRDEVDALNGRNTILEKDRNALDVKVTDLEVAVVSKEHELTDSNAQLTSIKSQNDNLADQLKVVNDKFDKLYTDFVEMTLHLEERFYPHLLTTIAGRRWLLTYGMKLAVVKCMNSLEYLSALRGAISRAIKKGMQDGLAAKIIHGKEGRVLTDVAVVKCMNSPVLDVSDARVRRIKENIARQQSFLHGVFVPLVEPFSAAALTGTEGTFGTTAGTITPLSTTFVSSSFIPPISTDDYKVMRLDGQEGACAKSQEIVDGNVDPFANVDDVDLNVLQ
nr:hypothetical protein [Tanacetum cinerariifolium]